MRATESDVPHQICTKRIHWIQISIKFNMKDNLFMRFVARQYWHVWQKKGPNKCTFTIMQELGRLRSGCCRRIDVCDNKSKRYTIYLVNKIGLSITISSQNFGVKKRRHKCMHDTTLRCLHSFDTLWFVYNKIYIHTIYVTFCNSINGCIKLLCINHQLNRAMAMNQTEYKASGYIANIVYLVLVDFSSNLSICIRIARRASTWDNFHEK